MSKVSLRLFPSSEEIPLLFFLSLELIRAVKVQTSFLDDVSIRYDFNTFAAAIQSVYQR